MIYTAAGDEAAAEGEGVGRYGFHLLALAHVYRVGWMKRACEAALAARLTAEAVVDVLQLARMCDAPKLAVRCLRFVAREFAAVQQTEGWGWVRANDPRLELEILRFVEDTDMRKKHRRKRREEQETYLQLGEAMDCLRHICSEGCTIVGPSDGKPPNKSMPPCDNFGTCWKMQLLICHFATCARKRACHRCKRVSQLFRLHSAICDPLEPCKVPLCRRPFKQRSKEMDSKAVDDERWRLLAKKVSSVRVMHLLAKRRRHT